MKSPYYPEERWELVYSRHGITTRLFYTNEDEAEQVQDNLAARGTSSQLSKIKWIETYVPCRWVSGK